MTEVLIPAALVVGALLWVLLSRRLVRQSRFDYFEERKWAPMDQDWRYPSSYLKRKP